MGINAERHLRSRMLLLDALTLPQQRLPERRDLVVSRVDCNQEPCRWEEGGGGEVYSQEPGWWEIHSQSRTPKGKRNVRLEG